MKPQDRIRRYTQLATAATIVVCVMLCFFLIVSPKASRLRGVEGDLAQSSKKLAEMRKEIENASILGTPAPGESRYEKFRILGADEEQLFLSDLIEFCKETNNTLNMVRPADIPRPATPSPPQDQNKSGSKQPADASDEASDVPRPIIQRVPHTVHYSGTFLSSFYLLRKLEAYKRLLTVERVEIATDTSRGYPRVNGYITIDLYLVKNAGQPPAPAPRPQKATATSTEVASSDSRTKPGGGGRG